MRIARLLILIFFLITAGIFGWNEYQRISDEDTEPPVITASSDLITVTVDADDVDFLQGVTAADNKDGDVTDSILVTSKSNFIEKGVFRIDYAAFDSHNNVGTFSRRAAFADYRSPVFSCEEPLMFKRGSGYEFSSLHAQDIIDGDVSNRIKVVYTSAGTTAIDMEVFMEVTNNYGDISSLNLMYDIYTNQEYNNYHPLLYQYIVYVRPGETFDLMANVSGYYRGGEQVTFEELDKMQEQSEQEIEKPIYWDNITVDDSEVDFETPGVYLVTYGLRSYERALENRLGTTRMYIVVTEE